jgi:hypothetical protein
LENTVKPRHLILIVAAGTGLILLAPTAEKSGQADTVEPSQTVKTLPAPDSKPERARILPVSFDDNAQKLKNATD